jgi:hypothetical protein
LLSYVERGEFHPASIAISLNGRAFLFNVRSLACPFFQSLADVVGHPVQPLSDMRRPDAVCAQYRRPAGVTFSFQVSEYSIEPAMSNRTFNLLTKHSDRSAHADEFFPVRPEVPCVGLSFVLTGSGKGLARARSGPHRSVVRPPRKSERVRPPSNPCEEMTLGVRDEFVRVNIDDAPLIYISSRQ